MLISAEIHKEEDGNGYWARLIEFPDCCTSAETLSELRENIVDLAFSVLYEEDEGGNQILAEHIRKHPHLLKSAQRMLGDEAVSSAVNGIPIANGADIWNIPVSTSETASAR